jgi:sugar phosphate permease
MGERPMLVLGPLGIGVATLFGALSPSPLLLALSLGVGGAFMATCAPAGGKAMLVWFPPRIRGLAMGLRQTSIPLAGVVAAPTLPLLAAAMSWRGALLVGAAFCGLSALLVGLAYRDPPRNEWRGARNEGRGARNEGGRKRELTLASRFSALTSPFDAYLELLRDRSLAATIALGPIMVAGQWTVVPYLALYLYERYGWPLAVAAGYLALAQLGGVVGRIGWGLASDLLWHGRRKPALRLLPPAGALGALGLAWLPAEGAPLLVGALAMLMGATVIGWNGLLLAYVAEQAGPRRAGTAIGLAVSVIFGGAVVVPPAFGWLVDRTGSYQPAWVVLAGVLLAGLALFPLMREVRPSRPPNAGG